MCSTNSSVIPRCRSSHDVIADSDCFDAICFAFRSETRSRFARRWGFGQALGIVRDEGGVSLRPLLAQPLQQLLAGARRQLEDDGPTRRVKLGQVRLAELAGR